jgi:hypothetical protein
MSLCALFKKPEPSTAGGYTPPTLLKAATLKGADLGRRGFKQDGAELQVMMRDGTSVMSTRLVAQRTAERVHQP